MATNPTIGRWQLAFELKRLRGGKTRDSVARGIEVAPTSITRWEDPAQTLPRLRDLKALLSYYEVAEGDAQRLLDLYAQAKKRGWWQTYGVEKRYGTYIGLEAAATRIETFESELVPGLFQTEDYARAVTAKTAPHTTAEEIEANVKVRLERQRTWHESQPETWAILAEPAIRHYVGGAAVMRDQLERLVELSYEPHVDVQVIPFSAGGHAALERGSFVLLHLDDIFVVYTEGVASNLFQDRPEDLESHRKILDKLRADAISPEQSRVLIQAAARDME
ncbi:MAG: helix-turn-helix transcriptional regulator [Nocardiopsaceae bacterium]|nr:helix-turn-helix transcriptional regulator [Nocardiopsaceae bacterium]